MQKNEIIPIYVTLHKNYLKWIKGIILKTEVLKLLD